MKKTFCIILLGLILPRVTVAQINFTDFVNSFERESKDKILNFGDLIQRALTQHQRSMSKEEALQFVYRSQDTSLLYCKQKTMEMDPQERLLGIDTSLYLPSKCLRVDKENYFLLGYTSYDCNDPQFAGGCKVARSSAAGYLPRSVYGGRLYLHAWESEKNVVVMYGNRAFCRYNQRGYGDQGTHLLREWAGNLGRTGEQVVFKNY